VQKSGWYLIGYDIREKRRLQRLHRYLKKRAIPVQKSLFFAKCSEDELYQLLQGASHLIDEREDDLRAWPINHPSEVWLHGQSPFAEEVKVARSTATRSNPLSAILSLFRGGA